MHKGSGKWYEMTDLYVTDILPQMITLTEAYVQIYERRTVEKMEGHTETRIEIRQTNGQSLVHSFGVKEPLSAVCAYVSMNRTDGVSGPVKFISNVPKKVFSDDDYENSLESLLLAPSAVLMVTK